ncbi:YfhD family protein [Paenibacillus cisolokensis]|nr:YfhD family protein [Paenibacillus cisolokensis]
MADGKASGGKRPNKRERAASERLPVGKYEDVEFAEERADTDDLEARRRAEEADARAERL